MTLVVYKLVTMSQSLVIQYVLSRISWLRNTFIVQQIFGFYLHPFQEVDFRGLYFSFVFHFCDCRWSIFFCTFDGSRLFRFMEQSKLQTFDRFTFEYVL